MNDILWKASEKDMGEFFWKMTDEEAQRFLHQYLEARDERLRLLNRRFYETDGGNEDDLDFTPDSLLPLWKWVTKNLRKREYNRDELQRIQMLPHEFREQQLANPPLSEESLILLNDVAYYFGEVLTRHLEGVNWKVCKTKVKRHVDGNQPVVMGSAGSVNPRSSVKVTAQRTLADEAGADALLQTFEKCVRILTGGDFC
jgi:hypothetical protein